MRGSSGGEGIECDLGRGVFGLPQRRAEAGALEDLSVKINGSLESRRMIRSLPYTRVRWQIKAAPLRQLLKLVLIHLSSLPRPLQNRYLLTGNRRGGDGNRLELLDPKMLE